MNRLSITRKLGAYALSHPEVLKVYIKVSGKIPSLPRGYRKIVRKK